MIPFSELQRLADKCRAKTGLSCKIALEYWSWSNPDNGSDLTYKLYIENGVAAREFATVQEFKAAVANILNPPKDIGVEVSTKGRNDGNQ